MSKDVSGYVEHVPLHIVVEILSKMDTHVVDAFLVATVRGNDIDPSCGRFYKQFKHALGAYYKDKSVPG